MKNVYTWAAKPAKRSTTVGDLKAAKGKKKFTQVTANTVDEAGRLTDSARFFVAFASPASNSSFNGLESPISPP